MHVEEVEKNADPRRRHRPSPARLGGGAGATDTTMPSAGLTIRPGRVGVTRHGSRKKYAIHNVTIVATQPAGLQNMNRSTVDERTGWRQI